MINIVLLFGIAGFYGTSLDLNSDDIQEGDCLSMNQLQELSGVSDPKLYYAGDCGVEYELDGILTDTLACGLELHGGQWSRVILEHKKPGFFWPSPIPCMASVTAAMKEIYRRDLISEESACVEEETFIETYQTEILITKHVEIAQGEAYLPNPLIVHTESYTHEGDAILQSSCKNSEIRGNYLGWGKGEVQWIEDDCTGQRTRCQVIKISPGEDEDGNSCAQIDQIVDCL